MYKTGGWSASLPKIVVVAAMTGGLALLVSNFLGPDGTSGDFVEPSSLSALAVTGKAAFEENCIACHGERGSGTDAGPPLVHDIYNPGHHSDQSFLLAAFNGVRAHHWPFGNMPPVEGITVEEVRAIVQYIRELQQANGIVYRPHGM